MQTLEENEKALFGPKKQGLHQSPISEEQQKPPSFSYHSLWPPKQSQLMNQKKAGYQMSRLINTHIAFCNGIQWTICAGADSSSAKDACSQQPPEMFPLCLISGGSGCLLTFAEIAVKHFCPLSGCVFVSQPHTESCRAKEMLETSGRQQSCWMPSTSIIWREVRKLTRRI